MKSFVDSNVLVYLFDQDAPAKKAVTQRIIQTEGSLGNLQLSTQVLQEFYVSVTRKLAQPLKPETALEAISRFAAFSIVVVDVQLIIGAIQRSRVDSLSFWDSLIIDAALMAGSQRLWSEDLQDGRIVNGMRIENPFL
jgi:predicted nucleic acid-binding protein